MERALSEYAATMHEGDYPHQFWRAVARHFESTRQPPTDKQLLAKWEYPPGTSERSIQRMRATFGRELIPNRPTYGSHPPWAHAPTVAAELLDNALEAIPAEPDNARELITRAVEYLVAAACQLKETV